jgi:hypothetical protein
MRSQLHAVILAALVATASACGGSGSGQGLTEQLVPAPSESLPATSTPTPVEEPITGAEVVEALAAAGLPVTLTIDYDETTDPNKQLGRRNGYVDKVAFTDARIKPEAVIDSTAGSVELGGGVEVFSSQQEAQTRADYIQSVTAGSPALTEYGYVKDGVLLRLSQQLTPTQAAAYETALKVVG